MTTLPSPTLTAPTLTATSTSVAPLEPPVPCRADSALWFAEHPRQLAVAQARCSACALREPCLRGALERREPWGVWGGRILVDGEVVAVKRGRGRPPRSDPAPTRSPAHS